MQDELVPEIIGDLRGHADELPPALQVGQEKLAQAVRDQGRVESALRILAERSLTFEEDGALGIVGEIATAWLTRLRRRDAIRRLWTVSSHWPATLRARIVARTIA